jgi:hypothetical protein
VPKLTSASTQRSEIPLSTSGIVTDGSRQNRPSNKEIYDGSDNGSLALPNKRHKRNSRATASKVRCFICGRVTSRPGLRISALFSSGWRGLWWTCLSHRRAVCEYVQLLDTFDLVEP